MKIVTIIGSRPQFVKVYVDAKALMDASIDENRGQITRTFENINED